MALTLEKLKKAREAGYSDEEILSVASQQNPKIAGAVKSGYTIDDIADFYTTSPSATSISEVEQIQNLQRIPEAINRTGGLPVGGEPEVKGDEDILAKEVGQTNTFMEGPEGKPVEVRRAQAIDIGGRVIPEPISPDGMTLESRGELIKEAGKIVKMPEGSSFSDFTKMSSERNAKLQKLQQAQQTHEANQIAFLSKMISGKSRTQVSMKTGLGEEQAGGGVPVEKETSIVIPSRREASISRIGDQREFIDKIIGNDKFLDYAASKGIAVPSMTSRMAGQYLGAGEAPDKIAQLKQNVDVRKLAEEFAMTSPDFVDNASDLFKRAWDGYAGAIGSGVVGPIGLALKEVGLENVGQELIDASVYADEQRELGQDPRKVGAAMQFGRDVSSGIGFTASALVTGAIGNTARSTLGFNSTRAVNLFQKANTLTFSGLNSAWQGYSEAKSDGATEEQANQAALLSGLTQAPLELYSPLQKWIGRFDPQQQKRLYKGLSQVATAIAEGGEEALFNEMPQQIVGNLVKQYVYKPNQDIFEGTLYAGGVGGASGVITSIFTQMIAGKKARAMDKKGDQGGSEETDIDSKADEMADKLAPDAASDLAQKMVETGSNIDNLKEEIGNDEMGLQAFEEGSQERQNAELVLNEKKASLDRLQKEFDSLSSGPVEKAPVAEAATPSTTIEEAKTKIEELNTEFDALDENDKAGIDRVNTQIFAEQNKIAELTAIEQGIEPQGTTPTREMGLPPSGRTTTPTRPRMLAGEFYADRPILKAFMSATDKVVGRIPVFSKRAQKLKNAIRTGIANNAGFLAGTNTKVITSEEFGKLTGRKQVAADTGTYRATFLNGQKYLVVPDINQLAGISIKGEQRAASKDAAIDQESRAAAKKLEEEVIHLSMLQGIQDEYKAIKKPKLIEQEYIVKRLVDIAKEVKRTNPNALPGVSNAYLNDKSKLLDDLTFSQEFMRMVIQRVRTGQITEDLNAIRQAEKEAFSDQDKGAIISLKNSILNALRVVRDSITRYLGKGTSTKEVEKMKNAINTILDEYGIVKGEANYEFKDYSAAQPKGELKAEPTEVTPTTEESLPVEAVSETITEPAIEARAGETPTQQYSQTFELFNKYTEPMGRQPIKVEATSIDEASKLIKSTEEYKRIKSRYAKVFAQGDPIVVPRPGESPIIARAGETPEVKPMSKRSQTAMGRITNNMVSGLEDMAEMLKPKDNKALKEYQSRATQKDKGYNKALISPYAVAGNLFTSSPFTAANNALNKIFRDNPDIDFLRVAQDMVGMDALTLERAYNISPYEQFNLTVMMYKSMPAFREEVKQADIAPLAREAFNLEALDIEAKLATKAILMSQSGAQMTQAAYTLRNIVGAGVAIDTYKSNIVYSMGKLAALTKSAFNDVANAVRGDRRKAMDTAFNVQSVFRKAVSMMKMAEKNPEKVRQAIRAEVGKKKNRSTREILLDFSAGMFDTKEDKYANMVVDQTVQHILAIGMNKKEFSIDNISKFMYQSFATAARQMGIQQAGIEKQKKGKRSGKYLEMVKAVIGNDNAYKSFLNDLAEKMAEKYPSRKAFNDDFADLFQSLRSNEWADKLRTQAIQDASEYLNYKFADLFTYLGEQRDANQESVKQHIRAELAGTGASRELVDKFIQDADTYLTQETTRILKDKLGFQVDKKTGKILPNPKPLLAKKIKEEAESQAKAIKNLKDITKLSATDQGNFKDGLISRIITEVGMPKDQATELANMIIDQIEKAMLAQKSENLAKALKKAEEVLADNKIKSKTNQRTLLQRLIEMANMGVLDNEKVYEAYRKTHNFEKSFLPYDAEFVNSLREWGDRIAKLPDGVIRSIEEEKMGRALMEKTDFKAGDILSSYWYYSLLSSIGTPTLNIMSGTSNLVANMFVWGMYSPKSIFPMLGAFYKAINGRESAAVNSFLYVMRYGMNPSGIQDEKRAIYPKVNVLENATKENVPKLVYYLTNFGDGKINFLPSSVNAVLKNISPRQLMRILRASDMFLREVAYEARLASAGGLAYSKEGFEMALRQAELEMQSSKETGKQKRQETLIRAKEIFRKIRSANAKFAEAQIEQDALETVFNQQPVGIVGKLANFANYLLSVHPSLKFFVPFTNVVANVTNEFINYTPIMSQVRLLTARQQGVNNPFTEGRSEKEAELFIKGAIGFLATVVPLLLQMNISGDEEDEEKRPAVQLYAEGPRDPKQQRIWRQNGGLKYSIRIGDKYFSILGTPLVIPLAMSAMLTEEFQAIKKKQTKLSEVDYFELAEKVAIAPFAIGLVAVLNQSFLAGVGDILGLTNSKDPIKDGEGIINGIISRLTVPGQLRDINKLYTNERAVGSGALSNLLKEMPGSINFLDKDVNYFGDPARFPSIVKEEGLSQRLASLFGRIVSKETPDEGFKIMYDLNLTPPSWDSSFTWPNGKQMTKTQQLEFIRSAGPDMRQWIVDNEADLKEEDDLETRQNLLNTGLSAIKSEYKSDLQSSYEEKLGIDLSKQ